MSIRLGEYIEYGELFNTSNYGVHGFLVLRGEEGLADEDKTFLRFELTGDCDADLKGKHICFEPAEDDGTQTIFRKEDFPGFNLHQHGPTGKMSAQGWVKALPCSVEEFCRRSDLGEPPPTPWRNHFFLEWFGPNGRVTVEMAGAKVECCIRERDYDNEDDDGDWEPLLNLALPPDLDPPKPGSGPSITKFEVKDNEIQVTEIRPMPEDFDGAEPEDPDDLQGIMDAETRRIDSAIAGVSEKDGKDDLGEMMRMDYCMEQGERKPFESFLGDFSKLPKPDDLDDEAVEIELKLLLGRLVIIGVVLDVCDHFTPRDCYRLLLDDILKDEGAYEELVGTGWTSHFSTWESCKECEKEMDKEFEEMEKKRSEEGGGTNDVGDDVPF
jgi:hypothetical protein